MAVPTDRRYLASHEWHRLDGDEVTLGLTQFAVDELTDVTYVDIRKPSGRIKAGEPFGEVESVKATSEVYCGIDGEVVAVNKAVLDDPSLLNRDPFHAGWLIRVRPANPRQLEGLLSAAAYDAQTSA